MWMPGRSGSTWVQDALNSHPDVTMLGEVFNNWTGTDTFTHNLCRFYRSPMNRHTRRVRGFKQKFFQCNANLQEKLCAFGTGRLQENALESCLRPATQPPPPGMLWDAGWNVTTDTYRVLEAVGARIVCSLRRSSLDRAISKAVQLVFHKTCGVSNAVTAAERACLRRVQRQGVRLDVPYVLRVMQAAELAARYNLAVCEAQARRTPVFFLWYEDLLANPTHVFAELQRFLGLAPRLLTSTTQRIVAADPKVRSWILNLQEVHDAAGRAAEQQRVSAASVCS